MKSKIERLIQWVMIIGTAIATAIQYVIQHIPQ